jgi:hypothetical protein
MTTKAKRADIVALFSQELQDRMGKGIPRAAALKEIAAESPKLYEAHLLAANEGKPEAQRQVRQRFAKGRAAK